ncbi:FAD-dependent oxidoreductase [Ramlibacter sp.]|uniref:FAD-dependent oxidoreductase n=1 Tax=Ramlibacter sp. TaxID=1917967 RepID=UPI002D23B794|nr:FAD-dependent oxidoreductase [Ramlibacter sp.]HYD77772.1 FAD-dependent oxidoreductase [Ramlibacter sp.]
MAEHFDAIVVGAGPSGNTAAYLLAKAGMKVLQLERGEYPGSKNVQGAILYAEALEEVIPNCRRSAPLERAVIEQRMWLMDDHSHVGSHFRAEAGKDEQPTRYTVVRANLDKWFSKKVQDAGALLVCETTVLDLLKEGDRVVGVRTDRANGEIRADVVVLADGVNSLVATRAGLRPPVQAQDVALAVKEMHFLPRATIEERFNIQGDHGVVIEMFGKITRGMVGTGFLYTNKESISLGVGCMVSDFKASRLTPYQLLEDMKAHPSVRQLIAGSEVKEYSAHLIPEGGYNAIPVVHGEGWVICGDSGGFVNAVHREGSNLAMTTGRLAAETLIALRDAGKDFSAANLRRYRQALEQSFVMKDLKKYRDVPQILHGNRQFLTTYPELLSRAAHTLLKVDGVDKRSKERQIQRDFVEKRSRLGLFGDAIKLIRAFR